MKRKTLSMNRTLAGVLMIGYSALLVLLLIISFFWISSTQREAERVERQLLAERVDEITGSMDVLDRRVYDTYASNRDFLDLSGLQSDTDNYQSAYYLNDAMRTHQALEEAMHGYAIYYDQLERVWYRSWDTGVISSEQMRGIAEALQASVRVENGLRRWTTLDVDGDTVLAVMCRRDNAAIAAVYSPRRALGALSGDGERRTALVLPTGVGGQDAAWADNLGLAGRMPDSANQYEAQMGGYRVYARKIPKVDLWVVLGVRLTLWRVLNVGQLLLLLLTAASIAAVISLYLFYRREFLRPTKELTAIMEGIRSGERTDVPLLDVRFREMQDINRTLASMVSEIEQQKVTIYEEIIERQKAELQFFQLQLRPHFYLNGLKTINALAINGDTRDIQDMVRAVSGHLRYLFQESHTVLLRDELAFVRNYLDMQRHVYGRQIEIDYDVAPAAEGWQVPILCVQTFVENSVKYARTVVAGMPLRLSVRVDLLATEEGQYLDLIVSDNCQGYSEEMLERINSGNIGDDGQAVGIGNIIRRCRLLYGERAQLLFYNEGGAVSELILPEYGPKEGEA